MKQTLGREFEMSDLKLIHFYLGVEIDLVNSVNRQADRTQSKV